jgi:hypothetical protein
VAQTNFRTVTKTRTHEGAPAIPFTPKAELERAVASCLLWEDTFYESGDTIANRICGLVESIVTADNDGTFVSDLAIKARSTYKLRHVPLLLCREMARLGVLRADVLAACIQRVDEITEFLALHPEGKKQRQVKKGIGLALNKFNRYQFGKYNRTDRTVTLRDAIFISHPRPRDAEQQAIFDAIVAKTLESPDTWEVNLSAGADKAETFTRLMEGNKLGALAFLRNLRNMQEAGIEDITIARYFADCDWGRVLPFRFITAAKHAPRFESQLEKALSLSVDPTLMLPGRTAIVLDRSYSMVGIKVSKHSELDRLEAAIALGIIAREMCEDCVLYSFSNDCVEHPARRGFAIRDLIRKETNGGTLLGKAVNIAATCSPDRIIVLTDEQSHDVANHPGFNNRGNIIQSYMVNVAHYENGIGYGEWTRINGWSESILRYILEAERLSQE